MKIVFVTHCLPTLNSHGGAEHSYGLIYQLKKLGYNLIICGICENREYANFKSKKKNKYLSNFFEKIKIFKVHRRKNIFKELIKNPYYFIKPKDEFILPSILLKKKVEKFINNEDPNLIINFNFSEAITTTDLNYPKITFGGDMLHVPHITRLKYAKEIDHNYKFNIRHIIRYLGIYWLSIFQKKIMLKIFSNAELSGSWCYQYSKWFKKNLYKDNHKFYRVTLLDKKKKLYKNTRKKIIILTKLSSFHGTSTLISLNYLFNKIFPLLEIKLKDIDYEIHVIGKGGLPKQLKHFTKHKRIKIRGFVKDLGKEISLSDVVLLPNPAEIGLRCRILNAFANYGCCVIHKSDTAGIPEIKSFQNCLVGNSPEQIASLTLFAIKNKKKRFEIKKRAREVFALYNSKNSIQTIIKDIKKIIRV
jgi:hypothetical protein